MKVVKRSLRFIHVPQTVCIQLKTKYPCEDSAYLSSVTGDAGLNPARSMDICLSCLYVVLSCVGRDLCDGLITRPEESYHVSVCVWSRNPEKGGQSSILDYKRLWINENEPIRTHDNYSSRSSQLTIYSHITVSFSNIHNLQRSFDLRRIIKTKYFTLHLKRH
jgi:hypothetical protein